VVGPNFWNSFPECLKVSSSISMYKTRKKAFISGSFLGFNGQFNFDCLNNDVAVCLIHLYFICLVQNLMHREFR
jgi:hypothetical protein